MFNKELHQLTIFAIVIAVAAVIVVFALEEQLVPD